MIKNNLKKERNDAVYFQDKGTEAKIFKESM